jgi:rubredoxin
MAGRLVTIAQYRDLPEAGLAKSKLEAMGITCFLDNQYTIGINWLYSNALGGVKLNVPEEDAAEATALLGEDAGPMASGEAEGFPPDSACPVCGATEIETKNLTRKFAAITLLVSLPLFLFWKRYRCKRCGHRWK